MIIIAKLYSQSHLELGVSYVFTYFSQHQNQYFPNGLSNVDIHL